jgi:hypothetical protein
MIIQQVAFIGTCLALAVSINPAHAEITSIAGDFTQERQQAWVELAQTITTAANRETDNMEGYIAGMSDACEGVTGKVMGMHAPNSIGMQIMGFCMAVGDINTEYKTQMKNKQSLFSSAPAYCGDFDQGLDHFQSMPNTPEYEFIYPAAQGLAAAAKKIKATEFRFTPEFHGVASLFGMDMRPKTRTVKCP